MIEQSGKTSPEKPAPSIMKSAVDMAFGTFSSRILGLIRDMLSYGLFDRTVTDAFTVAFRFPNTFRRLMGEGSLAVSFVPVYTENREYDKTHNTNTRSELSNSIWTYTSMVSILTCLLAVIFMEDLIGWLAGGEGFASVPGKLEMTINFARIMFFFLFFMTSFAFLQALSQAHRFFFIPAFSPVLFNVAMIVSTLVVREEWGITPQALAWGVLIGGFLQFFIVAVQLWKNGLFPKFSFRRNVPGFKMVFRNVLPGIIGLGGLQIMTLANTYFATHLPEGANSYIYLADRILELPQALIAVSLGSAMLPTLAEFWVRNERDKMQNTVARYVRVLLFLSIPASIGMYFLARPIVEVLFMRGHFLERDVLATASVIQIYAFLLIVSSLTKVVVSGFYAVKNTWLPAVISFATVLVHVCVAYWATEHYGLQGLVATTALTSFLNVFLVLIFYQFMVGRFQYWKVIKGILHFAPPAAVMGAFCFYFHPWILAQATLLIPGLIATATALFSTIFLGGLVYFIVCKIIRVQEVEEIVQRLRARRARA